MDIDYWDFLEMFNTDIIFKNIRKLPIIKNNKFHLKKVAELLSITEN